MRSHAELPAALGRLEGEHVQARWGANRTQSSQRAVGGHLYLTNRRLAFSPHAVDAALSGHAWWTLLEDVKEIARQEKDLRQFFGGGLRTRLKVTPRNAPPELFVVNQLSTVIDQIRAAATK